MYFSAFSEIKEGKFFINLTDEFNHHKLKEILIGKYDNYFSSLFKRSLEIGRKFYLEKNCVDFYVKYLLKAFLTNPLRPSLQVFENITNKQINDSEWKEIDNKYKFNPIEKQRKSREFYYNNHLYLGQNKYIILMKTVENRKGLSLMQNQEIEIFLKDVLTKKIIYHRSSNTKMNVYDIYFRITLLVYILIQKH